MLNAAGAQNSLKAGTGTKTMGKALAGLTRARGRQWKRESMEKVGLAWGNKKAGDPAGKNIWKSLGLYLQLGARSVWLGIVKIWN
jgi:hypothetical protein